jgi:hypothetical protein
MTQLQNGPFFGQIETRLLQHRQRTVEPASCSALRARDRLSGDASVANAGSVHEANDLRE